MDQAITQRLDELEREVRWWRLGAVVGVGLLGLVGLVGAAKPDATSVQDEIRAKRFVLVDEVGRARAKLDMMSVNYRGRPAPELRFLDEEERFNVKLDNRFGLVIADDDTGKGRVDLTAGGLTLSPCSECRVPKAAKGQADLTSDELTFRKDKVIWKAP